MRDGRSAATRATHSIILKCMRVSLLQQPNENDWRLRQIWAETTARRLTAPEPSAFTSKSHQLAGGQAVGTFVCEWTGEVLRRWAVSAGNVS